MFTTLFFWSMLGLSQPVMVEKGTQPPAWVCTPPPGKTCGTVRRWEPPTRDRGRR
jgi:hypothetical protein